MEGFFRRRWRRCGVEAAVFTALSEARIADQMKTDVQNQRLWVWKFGFIGVDIL